MNSLFGYDPQDTWLHRLTGATKMLAFLGISVIVMASYDAQSCWHRLFYSYKQKFTGIKLVWLSKLSPFLRS